MGCWNLRSDHAIRYPGFASLGRRRRTVQLGALRVGESLQKVMSETNTQKNEEMSFADLFESSLQNEVREGEIVKGSIVAVHPTG